METNNKLIAEFLGYIDNGCSEEGFLIDPKTNYDVCIDSLQFHTDWNWLMQVVEKIENLPSRTLQGTYYLGNEVKIYKVINTNTHYCEINLVKESGYRIVSIQFNKESKIKSVYDACLEFIKWYNENSAKEK